MTTRCPPPTLPLPELQPGDTEEWIDPVVRIYSAGGPHPTTWSAFRHWGPHPLMRFDHHPGRPRLHRTRGVSYAASRWTTPAGAEIDPLEVAILECYGDTGILDRHTGEPHLVLWRPTRPLALLQLTDGTWLARAGGNGALTSGARAVARRWSRAIYESYPTIDGLIWSSSALTGGRAMVLYERAADAVPAAPLSNRALADRVLQPSLARIAATYRLTLL